MTFHDLDGFARNGGTVPPGLALPELECYLCLRALYGQFRRKQIDAVQAGREKYIVHVRFDDANREYAKRTAAYAQYQQNIRAAGERWNDLPRRSATMGKDELIAELLAIVSAMVGEDVTAGAVRRAMEAQTR